MLNVCIMYSIMANNRQSFTLLISPDRFNAEHQRLYGDCDYPDARLPCLPTPREDYGVQSATTSQGKLIIAHHLQLIAFNIMGLSLTKM